MKSYLTTKQSYDNDEPDKGKYHLSSSSVRNTEKYFQYCKDSDGKYWTHITDKLFVKDKANKAKKESHVIETMQKEPHKMKAFYKNLKRPKDSISDSSD